MTKYKVVARLLLYFSIAEVSAVINEFSSMTVDKLQSMIWTDWMVLAAKILMPGLITIKAFMNTSVAEIVDTPPKIEEVAPAADTEIKVING